MSTNQSLPWRRFKGNRPWLYRMIMSGIGLVMLVVAVTSCRSTVPAISQSQVLAYETLQTNDGWAASRDGTTGGTTAATEQIYTVTTRRELTNPQPYYQSAQIFVLASRHEGMSNALLEAMVCGLPVIITDACEGLFELIVHGKNGLVVPVDDPDLLATAITQLATDPALRACLGCAAQQSVAEFSLPQILQQWESVRKGS